MDIEQATATNRWAITLYSPVAVEGVVDKVVSMSQDESLDDESQSLETLAVDAVSASALVLCSNNMASMAAASCRSIKEQFDDDERLHRRELDGVLSVSLTVTGDHGSWE